MYFPLTKADAAVSEHKMKFLFVCGEMVTDTRRARREENRGEHLKGKAKHEKSGTKRNEASINANDEEDSSSSSGSDLCSFWECP